MFVHVHMYGSRRFARAARRFGTGLRRDLGELNDDLDMMGRGLEEDLGELWGDGTEQDARDRRRARRDARRGQRETFAAVRRERRRACASRSCGVAGLWWLVFPLVVAGGPILEALGETWAGAVAGVGAALQAMMSFTLAGPIAQLLASSMGLSVLEGFALLGLAASVAGAAAWLGLRLSAPGGGSSR